MAKKRTYSSVKGAFVDKKMKEGMTNQQARNAWKKSSERKEIEGPYPWMRLAGSGNCDGVNIDRSFNSPWQDYAHTSDDI